MLLRQEIINHITKMEGQFLKPYVYSKEVRLLVRSANSAGNAWKPGPAIGMSLQSLVNACCLGNDGYCDV